MIKFNPWRRNFLKAAAKSAVAGGVVAAALALLKPELITQDDGSLWYDTDVEKLYQKIKLNEAYGPIVSYKDKSRHEC